MLVHLIKFFVSWLFILSCLSHFVGAKLTKGDEKPIVEHVSSLMNSSISPCDDFYEYACGGWVAKAVIPPGRISKSLSFSSIMDKNRNISLKILESNRPLVSDYYRSCLNQKKIEELNLKPLLPWFELISKMNDLNDLMGVLVSLRKNLGLTAFFSICVGGDALNPTQNQMQVTQGGGFSLPTRLSYLSKLPRNVKLREKYLLFVSRVLQELNIAEPDSYRYASEILRLEKNLASVTATRRVTRDPHKTYNVFKISDLSKVAPEVPWKIFFQKLGNPKLKYLNIRTLEYFKKMTHILASTPLSIIKTYLFFRVVRVTTSLLPKRFRDASFDFFGKTMRGIKTQAAEWERCVSAANHAFWELMGHYYVEETKFKDESKTVAEGLVNQIEKSFEDNLKQLDWMDNQTRGRALGKLHKLSNMVGYPQSFDNYSTIVTSPDDYFGNDIQIVRHSFSKMITRATEPVDMHKWDMQASEANAYYNILRNHMVFPAGILQSPFFSNHFPNAMNFGGIGMVVGHELTHGFDDHGSQFNEIGKMENWWKNETYQKFHNKTQCIEDQYSKYEPQPGYHINGFLTLGETIADLGGIKMAYQTYKRLHGDELSQPSIVPGFTNEQLFFLSYAQVWCSKENSESQKLKIRTDPHPPHKYRVIGTLSNIPEFGNAFKCSANSTMNPTKKCFVW